VPHGAAGFAAFCAAALWRRDSPRAQADDVQHEGAAARRLKGRPLAVPEWVVRHFARKALTHCGQDVLAALLHSPPQSILVSPNATSLMLFKQ